MTTPKIDIVHFAKTIPSICAADTAAEDGTTWSDENPTWGHCAVVALMTQKLFGGELLRVSLERTEFAASRSHYFNRLPDGAVVDATASQFSGRLRAAELPAETRERSYLLSNESTKRRYAAFAVRLTAHLHAEQPLMKDDLYRRCLAAAFSSPCKKMGFGALIVHREIVQATECNRPIAGLADLCEPDCIRLRIASRTESMLGACGHAEEWATKGARDAWLAMSQCDLYTAGVSGDGQPIFLATAEHSCIRCSVAMHMAGIRKVYVATQNGWAGLTTEECLATSKKYALGEKKIKI